MDLIVLLLILAIVIALVAWFVRAIIRGMTEGEEPPRNPTWCAAGLEVLAQRYARGEIKRDEYLQKKTDIAG